MRVTLTAALLALSAGPMAAQSGAIRAVVHGVWVTGDRPAGLRERSGLGLGGEAAFAVGPAALAVGYQEGSLDESGGPSTDFVEGHVFFVLRPLRWAALGFGPHVRSFVEPGGTQRWLLWEAHLQAATEVLGPTIEAYAEGWVVVSADVEVAEPFDSGRGLEGGLKVAVGRLPVALRLRYRLERLDLGDGTRRETVEQVGLAVGIGRR